MAKSEPQNSCQTLKAMASWKINASNEDMRKYFFAFDEFSRIQSGDICLVLGRKGSGKTAICEYLHNKPGENKRSVLLSFKDFPFDHFYSGANPTTAKSSQYTNTWKLIVLSATCWLMSKDPRVDYKTRKLLAAHFTDDPTKALSLTLTKWTSGKLEIPDFGFGATGGSIERAHIQNEQSLGERVARLEEFIARAAPDTTYYLLFDDLHEDYTGEKDDSEYFIVLTGLISAITHLRTKFRKQGKQIIPIAFVRDDIFGRLRHSDKNHWVDVQWNLHWELLSLQKMVIYRICADAGTAYNQDALRCVLKDGSRISKMSKLFGKKGFDGERYVGLLEYMIELTQYRPRDLLKIFRLAATNTLAHDADIIDSDDITNVEFEYSSYLRQEFEDEIHLVVPNFLALVAPFRKYRVSVLPYDNLLKFIKQQPRTITQGRPAQELIEDLWYFGVIAVGHEKLRFRYMEKSISPAFPVIMDQTDPSVPKARVGIHAGLRPVLGF